MKPYTYNPEEFKKVATATLKSKFLWFEVWEGFCPDDRVALSANAKETKFWCINPTTSLKLTLLLLFILLYFYIDKPL